MILDYQTAKRNFLTTKIKGCKRFFETHNYVLEQAYCEIIFDNLKKAEELFSQIQDTDMRAHWGLVILNWIKGNATIYPTYFEIRNFLELDLNIMINYGKGDYVEKIIRYADFIYTINPEVHKFIGRVFLQNGFKPQAMFFLKRAKDTFYQDPELHYILAEIYYNDGDIDLCKKSLDTCLEILPKYAPATKLLSKIKNM